MDIKETKEFIKKNNIDAEIIDHTGEDALTSEGAAKVHNAEMKQIIKVLLFIDKKKRRAIVIAQGNKRVNTKVIPDFKKARIARPEELLEILNTEPGGVPPINLPEEIPKYIDNNLKDVDVVFGSAGSRYVGIKMKVEDIIKFNKNIHWIDVVE